MVKVYLAGPVFSRAEQMWGRLLKEQLEAALEVEVFWPFNEIPLEKVAPLGTGASAAIFRACLNALEAADALVAILDGPQVDDGTAWEMGYFYARRQGRICGIRTDLRRAGETEHSRANAMIQASCVIVDSTGAAIDYLRDSLKVPVRSAGESPQP
jgi:nucleoside 2-deoxyribosyltransferase